MENNQNLPEENSAEQNSGAAKPRQNRAGLAARINGIISSPTTAVRSRHAHNTNFSNTGTNDSYEERVIPDTRTVTGDGYYTAGMGHGHTPKGENPEKPSADTPPENLLQKDHDDELDRPILGTP